MTVSNSQKHINLRIKQANYLDSHHHPKEKMQQLDSLDVHGEILEVFAGRGNLTEYYQKRGNVTAMTKEEFGNSFDAIYQMRADCKQYDWIDIDSYGYPSLFFPVVFELMKETCGLVFTFPVVGVQNINGITEQNFLTFWKSMRPTIGDVVGMVTEMGLRTWQLASLIDVRKIKPIYRFAFQVKRVKATEFCFVRNR